MARKIIQQVTYVDDLTGDELSEDQVHTVVFGWGNSQYEIDLSKAGADKLEKFVKPYVDAARRVSGGRGRPKGSGGRASSGSGYNKETLAAIRSWAEKNGHEVSSRGRIAQSVIDAYEAAHSSGGSPSFSG